MAVDSEQLLAALRTRVDASLGRFPIGALVFSRLRDLELLRDVAVSGAPGERAAAILALNAVGHPVELDLADELLADATTIARAR